MFTHEYTDKKFETYDDCADHLASEIDAEDIAHHMDLTVAEIVQRFQEGEVRGQSFGDWFQEQVDNAFTSAIDELIIEDEDEEVD